MGQWPKISVITPSYNQARFLEQTMRSVLDQGYPNLEYIVIDGGSTDGSVEIIRKHADRLAYWISEKDRGQTDAINKGFRRATGQIVAWLNSDDLYHPHTLETVAKEFQAHPDVDFVFGHCLSIDANNNVQRWSKTTRLSYAALVALTDTIAQPASFWRRTIFDQHGYLDESLQFCMDYDFFCRIAGSIRTRHVPVYLAKFRWHDESKSTNLERVRVEEHERIRARHIQSACRGWPLSLVRLWAMLFRTCSFVAQGDTLYVLRGMLRRALPPTMRTPGM